MTIVGANFRSFSAMSVTVSVTNASGARYRGQQAMITSVEKALKAHKIKHARIDIILLTDRRIRTLNKQYLQHDYATDVLTFPLEDQPLYGEIYVSLETARRQANEYGVGVVNELARLAVHGALHLLGYDDADPADRQTMHTLEDKFIASTQGL
ncbi:MAG: rRNA maturation RNase YbeY [Candidatus Kapabacteria bacterium]|nr:rRNA maturation RNase YbeY [Candidatus Kapabacteria bacterium]